MFEESGLTAEQKQAIRSMHIELADYVDEYITYGSVDFEHLAPVVLALQNVRNPNHEPTQTDLVVLWKVIQKAQRTHCGPKLPKEDRVSIYTIWRSLDAIYQSLANHLEAKKKQESAGLSTEKTTESESEPVKKEAEELFNPEDQFDFGAVSDGHDDSTSTTSTEASSSSEEETSESSEDGNSENDTVQESLETRMSNLFKHIMTEINGDRKGHTVPQNEEDIKEDIKEESQHEGSATHDESDTHDTQSEDVHEEQVDNWEPSVVSDGPYEKNESERTHRYFEDTDASSNDQ